MDFTKAHGTGNDFVVLVDLEDDLDLTDELVRALCNRRLGVGADGVLRLGRSATADVFMDYRNADGSIVEMCGNGVRVVAKHMVDHGLLAGGDDVDTLTIDTRDGHKPVRVHRGDDGKVVAVTVDMGVPTIGEVEYLDVDGEKVELVHLGIGNPHAVLRVDDVATAPVRTLGPRVERHERFPAGVNVEFAQLVGPGEVRLRVWERGVGETAACGTGACATQAVLRHLGAVGDEVVVHLPGGDLTIAWSDNGQGVQMTGPAVEVGSGRLDAAWVTAALRGDFDDEVLS